MHACTGLPLNTIKNELEKMTMLKITKATFPTMEDEKSEKIPFYSFTETFEDFLKAVQIIDQM